MKRVRLIQVGVGHMGKAWIQTVLQSDVAEYAAWVDVDSAALHQLCGLTGFDPAHCYPSLAAALAVEQADAVLTVTPPQLHAEICCAAAQAGLHVFSEKPLADTWAAATQIVTAARQAGVHLMVGQNRRYVPFVMTLRQLVASGQWGAPGQLYLTFRNTFPRRSFRDQLAQPLLVDMANHHFDAARFVLGREPQRVQGTSWNPPWSPFQGCASANVVFAFDAGLRLIYDGSWAPIKSDTTSDGCDWRIECEHGVIISRQDVVYTGRPGEPLQIVPPVTMSHTGLAYLLREFCAAVQGGPPPATSGADNLKTLAMVFAAVEAVTQTGWVDLPTDLNSN